MKHVFLDTNVLVDFAIDDRPGNGLAKQIVAAACSGKIKLYTSVQSVIDLCYFYTKGNKERERTIGGLIQGLYRFIKICDTRKEHLDFAAGNYYDDYEDAVQTAIAIDNNCDLIVSGDNGFDGSFGPPVVNPDEFCRAYFEE